MRKVINVLLLILFFIHISVPIFGAIPAKEREALIAIYNSTDGDNWTNNSNWLGAAGTEHTWYGVKVSNVGGEHHVTEIVLSENNLTGSLPSELGNFKNLQFLHLDSNQLSGSIPKELGNLTNLLVLYLHSNQFSGSIPKEFGNLTDLVYFSLNSNQLSGSIPKELENLTNLEHFFLHSNQLSGSIPKELGNLTNLKYLYLDSNKLSGAIPASLTQLSNLYSSDYTYIGYNALYTSNSDLRNFLNSRDPDWESTQTIAPSNVSAAVQSTTSALVSWESITFINYSGGYRVLYSTRSGGAYTFFGQTGSKSDSSLTVTGLSPGTTYYFVVQTKTDPHNFNDNTVLSEYSNEVSVALPLAPPEISLSRTLLNFAANTSGLSTSSQTFLVKNSGGGILNWLIARNEIWLSCSPNSGSGSGQVTVTVYPSGLSAGTHYAKIAVSDIDASNSPQLIHVTLKVYNPGATSKPIGSFETPLHGSIVRSSIPVTGWALDDIGMKNVKIYRGEGSNLVYIGDAVFVEGARPDVETAYPDYPMNYKAGWGYMMLTNFLPNGGNGTYKIHAIARDEEGNQVTLGQRTIYCDNANAVKPFGAIDTPAQGGTASGSSFINWGWVLTPQPNNIPTNGSTISVYVNGVNLGHPTYNVYRGDIATLFPGYANSNGAAGYFYLDTTVYENGVHTIQWVATDNAGNTDGIGSRYFTIQNTGGAAARTAQSAVRKIGAFNVDVSSIPADYLGSVILKKGFNKNRRPQEIYPDDEGIINIEIKELERVVIQLEGTNYSGFQVIRDRLSPLPIGSTLDTNRGVFSWQPGPGFFGTYEFVFIKADGIDRRKVRVRIQILPKYSILLE